MNGVDYGAIITYILQTVLALAIPLLVAFAFTVGRKAYQYAQANWWAKLNAQQQAQVSAIATIAVHMAEQIAARDDVKELVTDKKALAEQYVNSQLAKFGITLTAQEVEAQIEAAVSQQFNQPLAPSPADKQAGVAENAS